MAKITQEYCNECHRETWHEYQSHTEYSVFTKCGLCGADFDLINDGHVFIDEATGNYIRYDNNK